VNGVFGVGPFEMLVIAVLALIFIGPERLPKVIGQTLRTIRELRQYASGIQDEFRDDFREMRQEMESFQRDVSQSMDEMSREVDEVSRDVSQLASDVQSAANEAGAAGQAPTEPVNELLAPLPPREGSAPLPAPNGVHSNGSSHDLDEDAPVFKDYRPG
jgi:sec-independent protein translocase protein TatB